MTMMKQIKIQQSKIMLQKEREKQKDYKKCGNEFKNEVRGGVCYTICLGCKETFIFSVEELDKHLYIKSE